MTDAKEWLIRKNGYFYRPNKSGYTLEKAAAGRYTKDDADREAAIEPHNFTVIHESEVEDTPQVVDLSAEITTLRKELAEARAENAELAHTVEFVTRWAWREDPPNAARNLSDTERLSAIKYYPLIRRAATDGETKP